MIDQGFAHAEARATYERYVREHHGEIDVPRLAETMFNAGFRHSVQVMRQFSDILPSVRRIEQRVAAIHTLLQAIAEDDLTFGDEEDLPF